MPPKFREARDPISCFTHFIGAMLSVVGFLWLFLRAVTGPGLATPQSIATLAFGLSLVALYSASAHYHYMAGTPQELAPLRKVDHAMIYVLIAGSYTPVLITYLPSPKGLLFTLLVWGLALAGILLKLRWFEAPRWLSTGLYIFMGWVILFDLPALATIPEGEVLLLLLGGISYTIGGLIYALKRPNFSPQFGFHELFHLFVLLGSGLHFLGVVLYIA